jgi:hypothetical protein
MLGLGKAQSLLAVQLGRVSQRYLHANVKQQYLPVLLMDYWQLEIKSENSSQFPSYVQHKL